MLFLIPSIVLFCFVFYGVGFLALNILNLKLRKSPSLTIFLGICFSSLFFSIIQFFTPLNVITLFCVMITGFIGIALYIFKNNSNLGSIVKKNFDFILLDIILILVISMYFCSYSTVDPIFASDTLLYHSTVVSWLNYSKIVPGLANVHERLGMNSIYLILAAGIDVGIFDKYSSSILPSIILFSTLHYFFEFIASDRFSKDYRMFSIVLAAGLIISLTTDFIITNAITPNLYYDIPTLIFIGIIICELLIIYQEKFIEETTSLSVLFIFAAMAFSIKQIGIVTVFIIFCMGTYNIIKNKKQFKDFIVFISVPALFGVVYILRNLIQTGYPLYPLQVFAFDFKWTTPENAKRVLNDVKYSLQFPNQDYTEIKNTGFSFWFVPWFKRNIYNHNQIFFTAIFMSLILTVKNFFVSKIQGKRLFDFLVLMGIISINIIFWFISAPGFRFGSLFFFLLLAVSCYFAKAEKSTYIVLALFALNVVQASNFMVNTSIFHDRGYILNYLWCIIIGYILYLLLIKSTKQKREVALLILFFILFHPHNGHLQRKYPAKMTAMPYHTVEVNNGQIPPLIVYIPDEMGQPGDAPLPCVPRNNDRLNKLKLIEPGNMKKGFYIED